MAEPAIAASAEAALTIPYMQHFYPVLGILNTPQAKDASTLTPYARQASRSILKHFRGSSTVPTSPTQDRALAEPPTPGWDPVGPARAPRWQTVGYEKVDDIPRRRAWGKKEATEPRAEVVGSWVAKVQNRPATVISLHALREPQTDAVLAEEIARNRVCLAAYGLTYTAVVITNRAHDDPDPRLSTITQGAGLDSAQLAVCRPGTVEQFQAFLDDLERRLFVRAANYYADAFVRTQRKLVGLPQLPIPASPSAAEQDPEVRQAAESAPQKYLGIPLRAWLVRYHFKMAVFAECAGDRDTAQRCMWLAYIHLASYLGEIAHSAFGSFDGPSGKHDYCMFGKRWQEAWDLAGAVHLRIVRGWIYQSLDIDLLRTRSQAGPSASGWPFGLSSQQQQRQFVAAPVVRSSKVGSPRPPVNALGMLEATGNGSLDALVFSVHAGEASQATKRLMAHEREKRRTTGDHLWYYLALGSETADIDLLQPRTNEWWPLGGFYGIVDSSQPRRAPGLVVNSSMDPSCASSMLPPSNHTCLTLAARHCSHHIRMFTHLLKQHGFGDSAYFWAFVARQNKAHADLYVVAAAHGVDFDKRDSAEGGQAKPLETPVQALRSPPPTAKRASDGKHAIGLDNMDGSSTWGSPFPQWTWPETASPLYHTAALASLDLQRRLSVERQWTVDSIECSNPAVSQAYFGSWLAAEKAQADSSEMLRLLASSLCSARPTAACTIAAREILHPTKEMDALVQLVRNEESGHLALNLVSTLAEIYHETGAAQRALQLFSLLADRFRAEGWALLTGYVLRWCLRCARETGAFDTSIRCMIELLSAQVVSSIAEREKMAGDLLQLLAAPQKTGSSEVLVDMSRVYAPITCHAHWRHWSLPSTDELQMAFQVTIDCRDVPVPLRLTELCVRFSDARFNMRLTNDSSSPAFDKAETAAGQCVHYYRVQGLAAACQLELFSGVTVVEARVSLDEHGSDVAAGLLVLESVSAIISGGVELFWPTSAQPTAAVHVDSSEAHALNQIERQLLCHIGISRISDPALGRTSQLRLSTEEGLADPTVQRAVAVAGPAASLPRERRWLYVAPGGRCRWLQLPTPLAGALDGAEDAEPPATAYSRCRVLRLPTTTYALSVDASAALELAPAYRGEPFPLAIALTNMHRTKAVTRVEVQVHVEPKDAADDAHPWVSTDATTEAQKTDALAIIDEQTVRPQESRRVEFFVHFPQLLASAAHATPTQTALIRVAVRYELEDGRSGQTTSQLELPAVRPLCAEASVMPVQTPWAEVSVAGEHSFSRPLLVSVVNTGPWDVAIEKVLLCPPATSEAQELCKINVRTTEPSASAVAMKPNGALKQVFWLDIQTRDVLRMPSQVCPGTLEIHWRRAGGSGTSVTRLWMRPLELVSKNVQVGLDCPWAARVGKPLPVCYRIFNPTDRVQTIDAVMHAAEAFVFAGLRRTVLTILPGHTGVLRFNLLPLTATVQGVPQYAPGHAVLSSQKLMEGNATGLGWVQLPRLELRLAEDGARESPEPQHTPATPAPTRVASAVGPALTDSTRLRAQRLIAESAGLVVPADGPTGLLSAELAAECLSMVANHSEAGGGVESDVESDAEDGFVAARPSATSVVRHDQTTIFCLPS
ncbi:hypothetical protein GGI26_004174 [Coemansia sp. RSA 1358]|nr:hypothetical protein GGI26_004174 [Coemansia sp. RSA 1358]